jgi:hypothetical protein
MKGHVARWTPLVAAATLAITGLSASNSSTPQKKPDSKATAADERVTASGQNDWKTHNVCFGTNGNPIADSQSSETFVTGPGIPPAGLGSVRLATGNGSAFGDCEASMRSNEYKNVKLSDIKALSYWTNQHTNNGQQFPYLGFNVNYTGGSSVDDIIFFEPPYQSAGNGGATCAHQAATVMDMWQGWDALTGCWWSNAATAGATPGTGTKPLSDIIAAKPNAKIVNATNGVGGVRLAVGEGSPNDSFVGYVDSFVIKVKHDLDDFDFDPKAT